jgi:hypothetical protein
MKQARLLRTLIFSSGLALVGILLLISSAHYAALKHGEHEHAAQSVQKWHTRLQELKHNAPLIHDAALAYRAWESRNVLGAQDPRVLYDFLEKRTGLAGGHAGKIEISTPTRLEAGSSGKPAWHSSLARVHLQPLHEAQLLDFLDQLSNTNAPLLLPHSCTLWRAGGPPGKLEAECQLRWLTILPVP